MSLEAEVRATCPQTREGLVCQPEQRGWPGSHLAFGLVASRTVSECISGFLTTEVMELHGGALRNQGGSSDGEKVGSLGPSPRVLDGR